MSELVSRDALPAPSPTSRRALFDPPGGVLFWMIVSLELVTFLLAFVWVAMLRLEQADAFRAAQSALDLRGGLLLTLSLVTSGWLLAEAVHAFRLGSLARARRFHRGGVVFGLVFVAIKIADYVAKHAAGHWLGAGAFWDAYVLATGFHFAHVLVGLVMLVTVGRRLDRSRFEDPEAAVAGTALFWHMCDVAWFFLFPLFYARSG